jgi:hypothetical protein
MNKRTTLAVACVLGGALADARADNPTPPPAAGEGADQLVLPKGRGVIDAFLEINLDSGAAGKPISLSPDIWYGATDDITVGLIHSAVGETGLMGEVGDSLCLTGTSNGCAHVYDNVGADVRYNLKKGTLAYAFDGGLFFDSFDPTLLRLKLGLTGRWHSGQVALEFQPALFFGLSNRTVDEMMGGTMVTVTVNGDDLTLPATLMYSVTPQIAVALQLGLFLPFESTGDEYFLSLSFGAHYQLNDKLNLHLAFSLPRVAAGDFVAPKGGDARTLTLGGGYAF